MDIKYHFIYQEVNTWWVTFHYIPTTQQAADGLTKPLPKIAFQCFVAALGLKMPPSNKCKLNSEASHQMYLHLCTIALQSITSGLEQGGCRWRTPVHWTRSILMNVSMNAHQSLTLRHILHLLGPVALAKAMLSNTFQKVHLHDLCKSWLSWCISISTLLASCKCRFTHKLFWVLCGYWYGQYKGLQRPEHHTRYPLSYTKPNPTLFFTKDASMDAWDCCLVHWAVREIHCHIQFIRSLTEL